MSAMTAADHRALASECRQRAEGRETDGDQILKKWAAEDRQEAVMHDRIANELENPPQCVCPHGDEDCEVCS